MSDNEKKVFSQEVNKDDLNAVAGAEHVESEYYDRYVCGATQRNNCVTADDRNIYGGKGFPNCAATVEDGSHCVTNDACFWNSVVYKGTEKCAVIDCKKAWR